MIAVLGNDTDAEGDTLRLTGLDISGLLGTADILLEATGEIRYLPGDAFAGLAPGQTALETLGNTVSGGNGGTAADTLAITLTGGAERLSRPSRPPSPGLTTTSPQLTPASV